MWIWLGCFFVFVYCRNGYFSIWSFFILLGLMVESSWYSNGGEVKKMEFFNGGGEGGIVVIGGLCWIVIGVL